MTADYKHTRSEIIFSIFVNIRGEAFLSDYFGHLEQKVVETNSPENSVFGPVEQTQRRVDTGEGGERRTCKY